MFIEIIDEKGECKSSQRYSCSTTGKTGEKEKEKNLVGGVLRNCSYECLVRYSNDDVFAIFWDISSLGESFLGLCRAHAPSPEIVREN